MFFVSLGLNFHFRPNLEDKEYCEGQKLVNFYNGSLWENE